MRYVQRTGDRPDGCLTFWDAARFREVSGEALRLRDCGLRDNVALLVLLQPIPAAEVPNADHRAAAPVRSSYSGGGGDRACSEGDDVCGSGAGQAGHRLGDGAEVAGARQGGEAAQADTRMGDAAEASAAWQEPSGKGPAEQEACGKGSGSGNRPAANGGGAGGGDGAAPLLLIGNTHLLFNPRRGDIKARCPPSSTHPTSISCCSWACCRFSA